jgi:hypothetical protein
MKMKHPVRIILALIAATVGTSWGYAQMQMPMGQGMMGCPMMGMMGHDEMPGMIGMPGIMGQGMMGPASMAAQVEGRLAYLKAELGITEPQAEAWKQYEDAVRSRTSPMQGTHQEMMKAMQSGSIADRVKTRITMMEGMVVSMKAQSTAIENLYKVLTEEQNKKGDQLLGVGMM